MRLHFGTKWLFDHRCGSRQNQKNLHDMNLAGLAGIGEPKGVDVGSMVFQHFCAREIQKYALFASGLSALLISHADADERGDKLLREFLTYQSKLEAFSCELALTWRSKVPLAP